MSGIARKWPQLWALITAQPDYLLSWWVSPFEDNRISRKKIKKVVKAGVIYQRLTCVALTAMSAPAQKAAIIGGCIFCDSKYENDIIYYEVIT